MVSQRMQWMDFVRGICILLVIFVHASGVTEDVGGLSFSPAFVTFNMFMDPFRIPLLMFLSGMLLHKSLGKTTGDYIRGKFHLIFWPFLLWSIVTYAAENRLTLEYILKTPISAPSVLWYLWFLCAFYILALFLVRARVPLIPVIVVCVLASGVLPSVLRIDRFAALFAFFLLGHVVTTRSLGPQVTTPLALVGFAAAVAGGIISVTMGSIKYDPLFVWVPLGLITFVLWAASFYRSYGLTAAFEWIGRNSIVFYAIHFPALMVSARLASRGEVVWNGNVFYILLFAWVVALGCVVQVLRSRSTAVAGLFDFRQVLKLVQGRFGARVQAPPRQ